MGTLVNLCKEHHLSFVVILEPMNEHDPSVLARKISLVHVHSNISNNIWIFAHKDFQVDVLEDMEQLVHVCISAAVLRHHLFVTLVYAKHTRSDRFSLWETLREFSYKMMASPG